MLFVYVMVGLLLGFHLTVCGSDFSTSHAFSFPHSAFSTIRHNNICDFTASLLSEVWYDVKIEIYLQPLSGENLRYRTAVCDDDSRLDIRAAGFWGNCHQHAFFDVRVFNSFAPSNGSFTPIINTSKRSAVHMKKGFARWSMAVLPL